MDNKLGVAIVKYACPVCTKLEESVVMNTKLSINKAREIKELHNQVVGYLPEPCKECQGYMEQGIIVIGFDEEKSEGAKSSKDLYRSGHFSVVKEEWFADKPEFDISRRVIIIPHILGLQIGMFQKTENIDE